ncbi:son of sevenless homolog 1-like [Watersipora subatra]|uniref:son of sevenless homolog 1-like n=1 Tax=Watersipora subatra TaxID=2589382 RepID=UPI00355BA90A
MANQEDEKWKIFTDSLRKVQIQVHPHLEVRIEALQYIEKLIIDLLHTMCTSKPVNTADVIEQVKKTFPGPIDRWAIQSANLALDKKRQKKGEKPVIPVDKVHPLLKELLGYRPDQQVTLCIVAVLEYVAADILKLVGNYVKHIQAMEITEEDVRVSVCADKVLNNMFFSNDSDNGSDASSVSLGRWEDRPLVSNRSAQELMQNYEDLVKDLIMSEQQNIRELELIIKVFRPPFVELFPNSKDIDVIFSNILDVHSFSLRFVGMLEDTVEMTEQDQIPLIGGCFEDLLEGQEFDVYEKYMSDVMNKKLEDRLYALLKREDLTTRLNSFDQGFKDVVKYLLPRLLEGPIHHLKYCFNVMDKLRESSHCTEEDEDSFNQALSLLIVLKSDVDKRLSQLSYSSGSSATSKRHNCGSMHNITDRESASARMDDIQRSIENWEEKDINKQCYDFVKEGDLIIQEKGKDRERHAFLFDNMLILCKSTGRGRTVSSSPQDYRFKEKLLIKHLDVVDMEDTEEYRHAFEVQERNGAVMLLKTKTEGEKEEWMAALLSLLFRSNLDRMLDSKQKEDQSAHALILPPVEEYPFSEEDSEDNIVLEESQTIGEPPLIQGATLHKLIERLTYHMYADPNFVKRFLTTYRSFCSPSELLDLLICRFQIPETDECFEENRGAFTRFKKEYVKPVQFRVLNVIRLWTDHHFYDFEQENKVLQQLEVFLDTIKGKVMRKWVDSIVKIIQRKVDSSVHFQGLSWESSESHLRPHSHKFKDEPPSVEWFIAAQDEPEKFNIVYLHPIEIARQETLIEFKLYKAVKPSELVGSVFMKKDRAVHSPNLMRLIRHTNRFTYWLESSILSTQNLEERVAVVSRIIEIMMVFRKLNNLNGVLCVVSSLDSAPIHRLGCTFELLKPLYKKFYDDNKELISNHFRRYFEILRAIDPPCVPFFGVYMTNILKLEEGNPDCLPNTDLINFSKRRKVADITAEIQQYQNQPYNLQTVYSIAEFLEQLDPWDGRSDNELDDHLYELSLTIEPRNQKPPPKFAKKFDSLGLKSPGIKPASKQISAFRSHFPFMSNSESTSRFPFPSSRSYTTDDEDGRSTLSGSTPPHTPNTPVTPPPRPHTPLTPPPNRSTPPKTPPHHNRSYMDGSQLSLFSNSSTVRESQISLYSQFSVASTATLTNSVFEPDTETERVELKPPPLPPRRPSSAHSVSDLRSSGAFIHPDSCDRIDGCTGLLPASARNVHEPVLETEGLVRTECVMRPGDSQREHVLNMVREQNRTVDSVLREPNYRDHIQQDHSLSLHRDHRIIEVPALREQAPDNLHLRRDHRLGELRLGDHRVDGVLRREHVQSMRDIPPELPPKLPSRTSIHNIAYSPGAESEPPPRLPYSPGAEGEIPPRLPPRPSRSRGIERSGSMPDHTENRYTSRRNSGDHVNMHGVTPGTPQLPPRTHRPPNHGRQRSQ